MRLGLAALGLLLLAPAAARAEEITASPPPLVSRAEDPSYLPPPPLSDRARGRPLAPTGMALTAAGAALILGGGLSLALPIPGEEDCGGLTGCFHHPNDARKITGVSLLAGGLGAAAVGVPLWVWGRARDGDSKPRRNETAMRTGIWLTGLGVATALGGAGTYAESASRARAGHPYNFLGVEAPLMAAGGLAALTGVSLWAWGSGAPGRLDAPAPALGVPTQRRSRGQMITGIVMAGAAAPTVTAGVVLLATVHHGTQTDPIAAGVPLIAVGGLLGLVGVPLAIRGADLVPARAAATVVPSFRLGPTSAEIRLDF